MISAVMDPTHQSLTHGVSGPEVLQDREHAAVVAL